MDVAPWFGCSMEQRLILEFIVLLKGPLKGPFEQLAEAHHYF